VDGDEAKVEEASTPSGNIGNYLFWISFCIVGQPIAVLMYYRAWFMRLVETDERECDVHL
jgi:hypothetical protein